ncbi:MAG TPA: hypothetical protein PLT03_03680 [Bacillota bacterium]|nr:hypothetical protein [Bacillota bacterium]HOG52955.1 hypothetical protein [Bacillota bacterium]
MAATSKAYGNFALHLAKGRVNWLQTGGSTVKCALMKNTYTPNQDTQLAWSDISTHEVTGAGYTAGGVTLTKYDASYNASTNTMTMDALDAEWTALTLTARYAVVYVSGGTSSDSWLIAYTDFGVDKSPDGEPLKVIFNTAGIVTVTVS